MATTEPYIPNQLYQVPLADLQPDPGPYLIIQDHPA
jgi:hypothetical protein